MAAAIEGLLQNSFVAFTTLFIEYQYRLSSGFSSLISGALAVPALIIGSLLSGFIIKRYDLKMKECLIYLCVLLFLNLSAYTGYLFSCQEPRFIFNDECLTQSFENTIMDKIGSNRSLVLTPQTHCKDCDPTVFKPVCMKDSLDIVFESACLAGCLTYDKHTGYYSNCSYAQAISDRISTIKSNVSLVNGLCELPLTCGYKLYLEYIAIVLVLFFTGLIYIPYMKITFGCVVDMPEMNAIALGIKQLAMVGVGTIPGPIVFGAVIDLSCKYWYTDALGQKVCKVYNNNSFAYSVGFMGIGFKLLCLILIGMTLGFFNRPKRPKTSL
jgi:organic anion transporter 4A